MSLVDMMAGKAGSAFRFLNRLVLRRRPGS
ncbi:MAG: hypothetical protein QOE88_2816, partial [Verrucomicrobiota bacterium]|nr:hypothetical protein [Verrucomicrobiota bacterium]